MTFKDLQKLLDRESTVETEDSPAMKQLINRCRNSTFYYWGKSNHHTAAPLNYLCPCFNHIIGLSKKGGKEYPLFDYEHMVYRALMEPGFINTRKATEEEQNRFLNMKVEAELQTKNKHGNVTTALVNT